MHFEETEELSSFLKALQRSIIIIMWTFPINNSSNESSSPITVAKEAVEPTACETECVEQHTSLVSCVESIRAARLQQQEDATNHDDDDGSSSDSNTTTSMDTPECLPMAVAAWTKCCEEANLRQRAQNEDEVESGGTAANTL